MRAMTESREAYFSLKHGVDALLQLVLQLHHITTTSDNRN